MRKKTMELLIKMGIPANTNGFRYICDAMELYEEDETNATVKAGVVYSEVAKKYNASWSSVERCIRHAFAIAVKKGSLDLLGDYWSLTQKPTNGTLLACVYLRLKNESAETNH